MKRRVFLSVAAMTMLLATGCQNEELVKQSTSDEYTLTLDMGAQSRTMHDADGNCVWGDNEQIYVVGEGGKVYGTLTMKSKSNGGRTAVFGGRITGDPGKLEFMVYPVPEPDGTIPLGNFDGTNHNAPMTGRIDEGNVEGVDYAGGLVRLVVEGAGQVNIQTENADGMSATSGTYQFNPETGKLEFTASAATSLTTASVPDNGVLYIPVAPKVAEEGKDLSEEDKQIDMNLTVDLIRTPIKIENVEIEAGSITQNSMPELEVSEGEDGKPVVLEYEVVKTAQSLIEAVAGNSNIKLGNDIKLNEGLIVERDLTLHLDTFRLDYETGTPIVLKKGTMTLKGNSKVWTDEQGRTNERIRNVLRGGVDGISIEGAAGEAVALNVEKGALISANDCAVVVPRANNSEDVTINISGVLTSSGDNNYATLTTNGEKTGINVFVSGDVQKDNGTGAGIYFPSGGSLTLDGAHIIGNTGVYHKAGDLTIRGNTAIIATGPKTEFKHDNNGYVSTGDALVIENCDYPSRLGNIDINDGSIVLDSKNASPVGSYSDGEENTPLKNFIGMVGRLSGVDLKAMDCLCEGVMVPFVLSNHVVLTEPLRISKPVILDISKNNITAAEGFSGDALIIVQRGGHLTLQGNGHIDAGQNSDIYAAVKMTDKNETDAAERAALSVYGNITMKGYYYAISGNGGRHNTWIYIEGGTFGHNCTNDGSAIFHPQEGGIEILNGEFVGYNSAIEMRAGELTIHDGEFTATSKEFSATPNSSGTTIVGAAVALSQHITEKAINFRSLGGKFTGKYSLYEDDLQADRCKTVMSVHGGSFYGPIYSKHCIRFIGRGAFSHDPATGTDYLNENAVIAKDETSGMWVAKWNWE